MQGTGKASLSAYFCKKIVAINLMYELEQLKTHHFKLDFFQFIWSYLEIKFKWGNLK